MSMLGDLSEFALPDICQMFERSKKTGQLSIWASTGIHRIIFSQGRIVAAIAPESQYSLKKIMFKLGNLNDETIHILNHSSALVEPIGKHLKDRQLVNTSLLAVAFRKQLKMGIYPLFHLESGQFRFSAKTPIPYHEMTGMSKSSIEIAINGLRQCEAIVPIDEHLPLPTSRFMRIATELPLLKLSSIEWGVLEKASSEYTISDLSQLLKSDLLEVRQACGRLSKVSLLEEVKGKAKSQPEISIPSSGTVTPTFGVTKQPLPQKTVKATSEPSKKTTVNSNLLARFSSMLKNL